MRLLLVEDEKRFGQALKKSLESEAYAVDWEIDGQKGFEQARIENYDLLILDINLPNMSGLEIINALRKEDLTTLCRS